MAYGIKASSCDPFSANNIWDRSQALVWGLGALKVLNPGALKIKITTDFPGKI